LKNAPRTIYNENPRIIILELCISSIDQNDIKVYKLETPFHNHKKHTLHEVKGRDRNSRQSVSQERWKTQGVIGSSQFGKVWLQEKVSTNLALTKARVRVVKGLEK
jgi:hypothetical protein